MARNPEQNQRMRDHRRERILSSALEVFAEKGLAATRISDVALRAGMSQGLLYHYFRSKEEIYTELVCGAFERMNEAARALERMPLSPREKIEKAIAELLRLLEDNQDFARYFMLTAQAGVSRAVPDAVAAAIRKQRSQPYAAIARIIRAGQRDGSMRKHDADELAIVFWTTFKGLAMQRATFGSQYRGPDPQILANIFFPG